MEDLEIKGESGVFYIPNVKMEVSTGTCEISGESYLEDTDEFYNTIIKWIEQYRAEVKKAIKFNFRLTYFNTSSSRGILNVLRTLKDYEDSGAEVEINWYYPDDDDSIAEEAEDYMVSTGLKINMYSFEAED
ncbi:DUF1987 domain-containing protein [Microscilla marina]|uniref:SiaC family regulatory phosphoprotein domain-containing protein n=1 Tax=Microscilla marina ATCC 23134 TaxID=313606 RepID=A1ZCL4_MICM2|nr:DUF1987 domain-containing protein [Microscilla marina]EAY32016.1 conserved hypothetical protein [Microscilla marina ATCC 23134]